MVGTYFVGLGAYGLATGSRLTVPYLVIVSVAFLGLAVAEANVGFSRVVLVGLTLWGAGHLAGGIIELDGGERILYNAVFARWIHFDNVVHFIGFGTSGLAAWEAMQPWLRDVPRSPVWTVVVIALLGCGVGAVNEVIEFGLTHLLDETEVGGFENTGRDLVANLLGGVTAGFIEVRPKMTSTWQSP